MPELERSITINAPVNKVFSYASDPLNGLEWLPGVTDVRDIAGQGKGQKWTWTYKMTGICFKGQTEVMQHVPNRRLVQKATGGIASIWNWSFSGDGNKTQLKLAVEYTVPVPTLGKMDEKLVLRQNEREADLAMANIKQRLEG